MSIYFLHTFESRAVAIWPSIPRSLARITNVAYKCLPRYEDDTTKAAPNAPEIRSPPAVVNGSSTVKAEEPTTGPELNATEGQEFSGEPEQDDDEIDFNLGNGNEYSAPALQERDAHGPGIKEDG